VEILTVANWTPAKNVHRIAEALGSMRDLDWHWTLIGECGSDHYGANLRRDIAASFDDRRLTVVPAVPPERLGSAYAAADLFVLPSAMESYGLVFAEALTYGLPVLACEAAAVPETVGAAGILVRLDDWRGFAAALRRLLTDGDLRSALSDRARERAEGLPHWADVAEHLRAAIGRLHVGAV
jgi:glycosyltransferase involved in cell wall biosynthesis